VKRREFIAGLGGAVAWPVVARAQQPMRNIGLLGASSRDSNERFVASFQRGISEAGYVEGRNLAIEYRWADGVFDRLPALAAELVRRKVEVIVAFPGLAVVAAKAATSTTPIVFETGGDPVKLGLVASFNRPGGNLTGVGQLAGALTAKRLDVLRNLIPNASVIAVLIDSRGVTIEEQLTSLRQAARALGLRLVILKFDDRDIESAFSSLAHEQADALFVAAAAFLTDHRDQIVALAARHKVPAIYEDSLYARAGGLISYGADFSTVFWQLGMYAGKILNGEKPASLPVVQPTKFELVINLTTAKALGLTVPETLLATADEVIQ
jgi:putative tryptophan/tyrosine transport system substrate-binding protein